MGKVTILNSLGEGLYHIKVEFENTLVNARLLRIDDEIIKINAELSEIAAKKSDAHSQYNADMDALNAYINSTDPEIYTADPATLNSLTSATYASKIAYDIIRQQENFAKLRKTTIEKDKDYLQNYCPGNIEIDAWCVAYVEDLTGTTGSIENDYLVKLDRNREAITGETGVWLPAEITTPNSQLQHPLSTSQHANWFNSCMAPPAQRHKGRYRIATINSIDYGADTCSLTYDGQFNIYEHDAKLMPELPIIPQYKNSIEQYQEINDAPIVYLTCNSRAFVANDRVIVDLHDGVGNPSVIGFVDHPRRCGVAVCVIDVDSNSGVYPDKYSPPFQPLEGLKIFNKISNTQTLLNNYGGGRRNIDGEGFFNSFWYPGGTWTNGSIAVNWSKRQPDIESSDEYFVYISGRFGQLENDSTRHQIFGMCLTKSSNDYILNVLSKSATDDTTYHGDYVIRRFSVTKAIDGINDDKLNFNLVSYLRITNPGNSTITGFTKNGLSFGLYLNDESLNIEHFDIYTLNSSYSTFTIFRAYEQTPSGKIFAIKADENSFSTLRYNGMTGTLPTDWESSTVQAINISETGSTIVKNDLVGELFYSEDGSTHVDITFFSTELNIYRWLKIYLDGSGLTYDDHLLFNDFEEVYSADLSITNRDIGFSYLPAQYSTHAAGYNDNILVFGRGHVTATSLLLDLNTKVITTLNYALDEYDSMTYPVGLIHYPY